MPNTAYQKGVRFEREVMKAFEDAGCYTTRSAGSHGKWDVTVYAATDESRKKAYRLLPVGDARDSDDPFFDWQYRWQGDENKMVYFTVLENVHDSVWLIQCKVKTS